MSHDLIMAEDQWLQQNLSGLGDKRSESIFAFASPKV